jgi:hypothetical protein
LIAAIIAIRFFRSERTVLQKLGAPGGELRLHTKNLPRKHKFMSERTDFRPSPPANGSEPKSRGKEARRKRRERRNRDFKGLKLYPVMLRVGEKKKQFWRVTKPKVGGGRTVKTYANQDEAETAFDLAYAQAKNYGLGSFVLNDVQLIDAREAYQVLESLGTQHTLVSAVRFFADHVHRIQTSVTVKVAVAELLKAKKADG